MIVLVRRGPVPGKPPRREPRGRATHLAPSVVSQRSGQRQAGNRGKAGKRGIKEGWSEFAPHVPFPYNLTLSKQGPISERALLDPDPPFSSPFPSEPRGSLPGPHGLRRAARTAERQTGRAVTGTSPTIRQRRTPSTQERGRG
jgi:hypothetical protein